jgi:hypothetical protein
VEWGKRGIKGRGNRERKRKKRRDDGPVVGARSREGGSVYVGGTQKREKLSRVDYISSSIHSSGPPLHPGSLAVNQHLGPDHRHSPFTFTDATPFSHHPPSPPHLPLSFPLFLCAPEPRLLLTTPPQLSRPPSCDRLSCPLHPNRDPQRGSLAARAPIDRPLDETLAYNN